MSQALAPAPAPAPPGTYHYSKLAPDSRARFHLIISTILSRPKPNPLINDIKNALCRYILCLCDLVDHGKSHPANLTAYANVSAVTANALGGGVVKYQEGTKEAFQQHLPMQQNGQAYMWKDEDDDIRRFHIQLLEGLDQACRTEEGRAKGVYSVLATGGLAMDKGEVKWLLENLYEPHGNINGNGNVDWVRGWYERGGNKDVNKEEAIGEIEARLSYLDYGYGSKRAAVGGVERWFGKKVKVERASE